MQRIRRVRAAAALCSVIFAAGCASAPSRAVISPAGATTIAAYSPAIRTGNLVFLSGQIGIAPGASAVVSGGIGPETRQVLANIARVLTAAGLDASDVVKCSVFLADIAEFEAMNAVYAEFFTSAPPARTTVAVAGLPRNARVEIECIARVRR